MNRNNIVALGAVKGKRKYKAGDLLFNEKHGTDIKILREYSKGVWEVRIYDGLRLVGEVVMFDKDLNKLKRK